jgi:hypothetical protein
LDLSDQIITSQGCHKNNALRITRIGNGLRSQA